MRTRLLFQEDSYLREFEATVSRVEGSLVFLDATAFHPTPYGGLDTDTGVLESGRGRARVLEARVVGDEVGHVVDDPSVFAVGDRVRGVIDWDRRYSMMKLHTASHILASVLYERHGAMVTGGHITWEYARDDFSIESSEWKRIIEDAVEETNRIIARCLEVRVYWLPREEALKIPGLVKLADKMPPEVERVRIVEIPGVDIQADGGPHVKNTCEIGGIRILKFESKGRRRRRVYYTLAQPRPG
ncbi:MAG: alanyl-tRNA editing protein [Desulfurococcales archaeon]|nr:alanyl-tRNA editing protein [Desulfurococcales archaeon]